MRKMLSFADSVLCQSLLKLSFCLVLSCLLLFLAQPIVIQSSKPDILSPIAAASYTENFDAVFAPNLPPMWTTNYIYGAYTTTNTPHTSPNAVFVPAPAFAKLTELISPPLVISDSSQLTFNHKFRTEFARDGGVLEIKVNTGNFQDIISAGGNFVSNGYNSQLEAPPNPQNQLAGRSAWSGTSNGYITTTVTLPVNTVNQTIQFRWRLGTDEMLSAANEPGWWIDTVSVTNASTAKNSASITIPNVGAAQPYPSELTVSGLSGSITKVIVNLENFSHTYPKDVDLMLVAPNGRNIILMSDVGGNYSVSNLSLSFDDSATTYLPENASLSSGIFKPTDFEVGDTFPSPAPSGTPTGSSLAAFIGGTPNGTWKLFLVDDTSANSGSIAGGWSIIIQTSITDCRFTISPTVLAFQPNGGNGSFNVTFAPGSSPTCSWTANSETNFVTITSGSSGTGNGMVNFVVSPNQSYSRTSGITVSSINHTNNFMVQQTGQ